MQRSYCYLDLKGDAPHQGEKVYRAYKWPEILADLKAGNNIMIHRSGIIERADRVKLFTLFNYVRDRTFIIDEAAWCLNWPPQEPETKHQVETSFIRAKTLSHNLNHNLIMASQFPCDIPKVFLQQMNYWILFKLDSSVIADLGSSRNHYIDRNDCAEIIDLMSKKRYPKVVIKR